MKVKLIDLEKYPSYTDWLPLAEALKDFDIFKAMEDLKKLNIKDAETIDQEYWHCTVFDEHGLHYDTNWNFSEEELKKDLIESFGDNGYQRIRGEWRYLKLQSPNIKMPDQIKEMFQQYLSLVCDSNVEIEIHSIVGGFKIPDHRDKPDIPVNASINRNLVISLEYPRNSTPDQVGVYVDQIAFTPESAPIFLFDSQWFHAAWNNTTDVWTFVVIYIPTELVKDEKVDFSYF